jgi:hypothetical protein
MVQHAQRVGSELRFIGIHADGKDDRRKPAGEHESGAAEEECRLHG